jgi:anti-sigma factor RsiW
MSTPCDFYVDAIGDLAVGQLEPERKRRVERHVTTCADCAALLEAARAVRTATAPIPAGLEARIRVAVRAAAGERAGGWNGAIEEPDWLIEARPARPVGRRDRSARARSWRPWAVPLAAAAALALVWVGVDELGRDAVDAGDAQIAETEFAPYGTWPAADGRIAGDPLLSELSEEQLERLLEEMGS